MEFRTEKLACGAADIYCTDVEMVKSRKCLGTISDDRLKFDKKPVAIVKKSQQRLYFLRK